MSIASRASRFARRPLSRRPAIVFCVILTLLPVAGTAGTIVRVSTSIGDYSIELLEDTAPITVENFLNYVDRDAYNGTYLHRVVDDFVVQGGGYRFELFVGPIDVPPDPPIPNEFNVSNTRGTVAMAKVEGDPDSATSQWFVNLTDNTELDTSNGGFTVFGNVLGDGMAIVNAIDDLPTVSLGTKAPSAPYFTESPHVFESASGLLITSVNVNDGEELISINFNLVPDAEDFVIEANLESMIPRREFDDMADFNTADGKFRIPALEINDRGDVFLVNDVVFSQSPDNPARFVLESFEMP